MLETYFSALEYLSVLGKCWSPLETILPFHIFHIPLKPCVCDARSRDHGRQLGQEVK